MALQVYEMGASIIHEQNQYFRSAAPRKESK